MSHEPHEKEKGVRVHIHGRVQGVWFRGWTEREAVRRGLRGWVRNRRDGSVEAAFVGPPEVVDDMLAACREGPRAAMVVEVDERPVDPGSVGPDFAVKPTE